ncbi:MAG: hypothetical protein EBS05_01835 [Proteobacteria bacterium]|nr:hypothetical protein [Pseudomonadota bacterium]
MNCAVSLPRPSGLRTALALWFTLAYAAVAATPQTIYFRNGDMLLGHLESITPTNNLRWRHPDSVAAIDFQTQAITEVQLGSAPQPATSSPAYCLARLTNGDELAGNLISLDERQVVLATWYAGTLNLPRGQVASLRPLGLAPQVVFEGPTGLDGWTMGKSVLVGAVPSQWQYQNGAFVAGQPASIARDVKLPPSASLEFDLAWRGSFALAVALFTDSLQPVRLAQTADEAPFCPFYSLQLNSYSTQLLHVKHQEGARQAGMAVIPMLQQTNQARIAIKCSREQKTITLFLNGVMAKQWHDPAGFGGDGTGIRLVHQGQGPIRLSNLRVTEWDGRLEEPAAPLAANVKDDVCRLVNRDTLAGTAKSFQDGRLTFTTADRPVEVPLARIAQVDFATEKNQPVPAQAGAARIYFAGRGRLTLALEGWTEKTVTARSGSFGRTDFAPQAFSRIVFEP